MDYNDIGVWTLTVTQTVSSGTSPVFDGVKITVGCTIARIENPTAPAKADREYNVYDQAKTIDLSTTNYVQIPNCNYVVTEAFVWTLPASSNPPISEHTTNKEALIVGTNKKQYEKDYTVRLTNTIKYNALTFTPYIEFVIHVYDPCKLATIQDTGITSMTVVNGVQKIQKFTKATDTVEVA